MNEPIRLLIVDDHRLVRDGLVAYLRSDPGLACVGEGASAEEALRQARELKPDLVLMDIGLPDIDGVEATRRLLAEQPDLKVLILSMHKDRHHVEEGLKAGACGYVHKDIGGPELLRIIKLVQLGGRYLGAGIPLPGGPAQPPPPGRPGSGRGLGVISEREREVLVLIAQGLSNKEVARRLDLSVRTVEAHRLRIGTALGIDKPAALARFAIEQGLLPRDRADITE